LPVKEISNFIKGNHRGWQTRLSDMFWKRTTCKPSKSNGFIWINSFRGEDFNVIFLSK